MGDEETVIESIPREVRRRRALIKAAVTVGIIAALTLLGFAGRAPGSESLADLAPFLAIIAVIGGYDTFRTFRNETRVVPSAEAVERRRSAEAEKIRKAQERDRKWYVRYPMAALFLGVAYYLATGPKADRLWWLSIIAVVLAAFQAWELTLLAIGTGLIIAVFQGMAALPVSVAIIIGAVIVALALRGKN